ncbi:thiamine-monophosphate kinase [Streptomyces sp. NPDC001401]|uniref:thiamine-phosphate kinase n=1 Tax=Streptomyces sp. NPDC001401 TaxID=3364570 RepID=UPI00369A7841
MRTEQRGETISQWGEKRLVRDLIRPLFNPQADPHGVGDDCAVYVPPPNRAALLSTDRVPADLIAFAHGLIDYRGFGAHLAALNISDVAACRGEPVLLLLNTALPAHMRVADFRSLCEGVLDVARPLSCRVKGGDMSSSPELSCSATIVGICPKDQVLLRRGAKVGDIVFASRPAGMTPTAFHVLAGKPGADEVPAEIRSELYELLRYRPPMVELGRALATSGYCTSCMDQTDGLGQTLWELAEASDVRFDIDPTAMHIPDAVLHVARAAGVDACQLALGPGHDFSLVGTLRADTPDGVLSALREHGLHPIGAVTYGNGIWLSTPDGPPTAFVPEGWNYFTDTERSLTEPLKRD